MEQTHLKRSIGFRKLFPVRLRQNLSRTYYCIYMHHEASIVFLFQGTCFCGMKKNQKYIEKEMHIVM
jgi:hypothetical protein